MSGLTWAKVEHAVAVHIAHKAQSRNTDTRSQS